MTPTIHRPQFRKNQFMFVYSTWQTNCPLEYFHAHEGIEFLYIHDIQEGTGRLVLGERIYSLKPRSLVIFQPYQLHLLRYDVPYLRSLVKIRLPLTDPVSDLFPQLSAFLSFLEKSRMDQQIFRLNEKQDEQLNALFALFAETLQTVSERGEKEQFLVFLLQFLSFVKGRLFGGNEAAAAPVSPRQAHHVEKIAEWIRQHFREPFDLERLACDVHLSASYLSSLFRQHTGTTITEHILNRRLEEACRLLQLTRLPIDQVGKKSGFPNPAYFCRCFKKRFGMTPQQYRNKTAQGYAAVESRT
jgi:AraC-like DNA-binding protein